jgi:ATP-binding cassette subfamily B protein
MKGAMPPGGRKIDFKMLGRVIRLLYQSYPRLLPTALGCMIFSAIVSACPALFTQEILGIVDASFKAKLPFAAVADQIIPLVLTLLGLYILSIISITIQTQLMAYITQGFLSKMRRKMFDGMQNLPIRYFDTHQHGDI